MNIELRSLLIGILMTAIAFGLWLRSAEVLIVSGISFFALGVIWFFSRY